jgi:hypothetical protein
MRRLLLYLGKLSHRQPGHPPRRGRWSPPPRGLLLLLHGMKLGSQYFSKCSAAAYVVRGEGSNLRRREPSVQCQAPEGGPGPSDRHWCWGAGVPPPVAPLPPTLGFLPRPPRRFCCLSESGLGEAVNSGAAVNTKPMARPTIRISSGLRKTKDSFFFFLFFLFLHYFQNEIFLAV